MVCRILSLDGGGVRGVIPASLLDRVDLSGIDAVVGTSVGAGLGAMVAKGMGGTLADRMEELAVRAFRNRFLRRINPFVPTYSSDDLYEVLDSLLGFPASSLRIPWFATSLRFCENPRPKMFDRTDDWKVSEVCMASMSAPTYFTPYKKDDTYWLDGGLWANNPSVAGAFSLKGKLGIPFDKIRLLSLATGAAGSRGPSSPSRWTKAGWGLYLFPYITEGNVMAATYGAARMGLGWYKRFEGPLRDPSWSLDRVDKIKDMFADAQKHVEEFKQVWDEFMS